MTIDIQNTGRGFARGEFKDRYGAKCSIQKSSIAFEDCIWLGCDHEIFDHAGTPCGARMHLTQIMVIELLPMLEHFARTGELPSSPKATATSQQSASPSPPPLHQDTAAIGPPPIPTSPDTNNQEK